MIRALLLGVGLFVLCLSLATGVGYAVNHWILGEQLWTVIDLVLGALFGIPLFLLVSIWLLVWSRRRAAQSPFR